jgi:predicted Ser/Thr protein kinase
LEKTIGFDTVDTTRAELAIRDILEHVVHRSVKAVSPYGDYGTYADVDTAQLARDVVTELERHGYVLWRKGTR